ncbi:MAG TPA: molecular chaperone HtpG [Bacteroidia bacterium]|nr:molecular chaperone HtpG [Bacteroidia bacterium]HRS59827.1 molecular chaperone HtpG [Bacteroidia bacterium]HRU69100.1 molecular chaperone HtpG [Bacteroidia bacterium]
MKKGTLSVNTQDIFPIIKKFLYTDHEIFLRELISNATDAIKKLQVLASKGELQEELGRLKIEVKLDKKAKTLSVIDNGIGMTEEEIEKYINQIAFSSAEEFLKKYEQSNDKNLIIGHFGLGFYSAFMVADKVEIITKSYIPGSQAIKWECSGNTEFKITESKKKERGTEVKLHIADDSAEFLEEYRINELLKKYCQFMPVEIEFGSEKTTEKTGITDKDGKEIEKEVEKPKIINNTKPLWTRPPQELTDEDYKSFYEELYPFSQPPLFWIHLNVDYPFHLTGILYFPKVTSNFELQKNKIKLFSNQVYVTDSVDQIVPEFLTLLHGVIDSPDIPLNVSRSALQADSNVKKISSYIIRKVSDKLQELFNKDREEFQKKWDDIDIFVKYGMLTEDKFYEKAVSFFLLKDVDDKYYTFEEYKELVRHTQEDKDKNIVWLYTTDKEEQMPYIEQARKREYNVLFTNEILDAHFFNLIEQKFEKTKIKRVDAGALDELIDKGDKRESVLSKEKQDKLQEIFKSLAGEEKNIVKVEALSPDDQPVIITEDEFFRRMNDMAKTGAGFYGMGAMPPMYNIVINSNHPLTSKIANMEEKEQQQQLARQLYDLARLSKNILKGKDLTDFIERSLEIIK